MHKAMGVAVKKNLGWQRLLGLLEGYQQDLVEGVHVVVSSRKGEKSVFSDSDEIETRENDDLVEPDNHLLR